MKHTFCSLLVVASVISSAKTLDDLALKYGTDKSSAGHNYTPVYEKYFNSLKEQPIKFLEIGFWHGYSAHMWEEYFTNAQLFFIDINSESKNYFTNFNRSSLNLVNQEDFIALTNFAHKVGGNFDIIIDDGGHTMNQQITSFTILFPFLKSGGIYVIEDLHTSYPFGPNPNTVYGCSNGKQQTTINFLKTLIDDVNKIGAQTGYANFNKCSSEILTALTTYEKEIESIHFHCSLCFIIKR